MDRHTPGSSRTVFCPHCAQQLSVKTFKAHRRLYFDSDANVWCKKKKVELVEDFSDIDILRCFESDSCDESGDMHQATAGPGFGDEPPHSGPSTGDLSGTNMDSGKDQNLGIGIPVRPLVIHYFAEHSIECCNNVQSYCLVAVSWLKEHTMKDSLGKPLQLWWKDLYHSHLAYPVFVWSMCAQSMCLKVKLYY